MQEWLKANAWCIVIIALALMFFLGMVAECSISKSKTDAAANNAGKEIERLGAINAELVKRNNDDKEIIERLGNQLAEEQGRNRLTQEAAGRADEAARTSADGIRGSLEINRAAQAIVSGMPD